MVMNPAIASSIVGKDRKPPKAICLWCKKPIWYGGKRYAGYLWHKGCLPSAKAWEKRERKRLKSLKPRKTLAHKSVGFARKTLIRR